MIILELQYRHALETLQVWFQTAAMKRVLILFLGGSCLQFAKIRNTCEAQ